LQTHTPAHPCRHLQHHEWELRGLCIRSLPDGTKISTGVRNLTCQEFGLLAPQMLKDFCKHKSWVNCRSNVVLPPARCTRGQGCCRHSKSFHHREHYMVLRLPLNLLKCTLVASVNLKLALQCLLIKGGTIICTIVICTIIDNIAARRLHFQAASLLPGMMLASNRPGGEPTGRPWCHRHHPPIATLFGFHRSLALPLPQPMQSLVVVIVPL
jgi:hypothetical protein